MSTKPITLDRQELLDALAGRQIFFIGIALFLFAVVGVSALSLVDVPIDLKPIVTFGSLALAVVCDAFLYAAAMKARTALGLSAFGIAAGCLLSLVIPCFFLALIFSLWSRFNAYFDHWRMHFNVPSWSPKDFVYSEMGTNWQTITIDPTQRYGGNPAPR